MRVVTLILAGVLVLGLVGGPALGQTCDNTYIGPDGGDWQTPWNWLSGAPPNASQVACIPADKRCVIVYDPEIYDAHAKAIVLAADGEDRAELEIEEYTTLTIYEDSTVDGVLSLKETSWLRIANSLTITGNGGEIKGIPPIYGGFAGVIDHADGADLAILRLASATPGSRDTSLVVHGSLEIKVALRHSAYVVAEFKTLYLTEHTKWGSSAGHWIAETSGHMNVGAQVVGPAHWLIQDDSSSINIFVDCPLLTGDVVMTDGLLEAAEDFVTTGNVSIKSIVDGQDFTAPRIWVDADAEVRFGS